MIPYYWLAASIVASFFVCLAAAALLVTRKGVYFTLAIVIASMMGIAKMIATGKLTVGELVLMLTISVVTMLVFDLSIGIPAIIVIAHGVGEEKVIAHYTRVMKYRRFDRVYLSSDSLYVVQMVVARKLQFLLVTAAFAADTNSHTAEYLSNEQREMFPSFTMLPISNMPVHDYHVRKRPWSRFYFRLKKDQKVPAYDTPRELRQLLKH